MKAKKLVSSLLPWLTQRLSACPLLLLLVLIFLSQQALAQSTFGALVGTVTDANGAVVPRVSLTVTNVETNFSKTVQTNGDGNYEATHLLPGIYRLRAELSGFKTFARAGVIVESRATVRIDFQLEVGGQTTTVEVKASTPVIETESPQIAKLRTARQLDELPSVSNGEALPFILTTPGVQSVSINTFSFNGSRAAQSEYTIDGITSPRSFATPLVGTQNTFEMTAELKVQGANNSAEFGSPGVISVITKSGANNLHGSVFYFHSNSALNARNFFTPVKPKTKTHNFGLALGGPVSIPKLYNGHDRTFFMLSYWGERVPGVNQAVATVPTAGMRLGDFSRFTTPIIDPVTGAAFPGNIIPTARLNATSLRIQTRFFPLPNFGNPDLLAAGNFRSLVARRNLTNKWDARIDQKITDRNMLYARYAWRGGPQEPLENLPTIGNRNGYRRSSSFVLSDTHTFSQSLVNEFRIGFQRSPNQVLGPLAGQEVLGFTGIQGVAGGEGLRGLPRFVITGLTSISSVNHTADVNQVFQGADIISWTRSNHTIKSGLDLQRTHANGVNLPPQFFGQFNFTPFFTGNAYADFLLGLPASSTRATYQGATYLRATQLSLFVTDDWKLNRRVTLSLGARYEYEFAPVDKDGLFYNLDPRSGALVAPDRTLNSKRINPLLPATIKVVSAAQAGYPQTLLEPDKNNLVPRLGLAVRPWEKTVIRAGYGIYLDNFGMAWIRNQSAPVFSFSETFQNTDRRNPTFSFPNPFGAVGSLGTITASGVKVDFKNPYMQQWSLTVEREVFAEIGVRASYIGSKSTQLGYRRDLNVPPPSTTPFTNARRPFPQFGALLFSDNGGNSIYHGLQVDAERRFTRGLYFQAAWTYSNNLSDAPDDRSDLGGAIENPYDRRRERGRETYSVRHRLNGGVIYELPVGQGRRLLPDLPGIVNHLIGGWTVSSLFYFETGRYFTPTFAGVDISGTGIRGGRPDRLREGNLPPGERDVNRWFDVSAFAIPAANSGRFGTAARNILEGPGLNVQHFSLLKRVYARGEKTNVQFQLNVLNLFNHPNFDLPRADISAPGTVGRIAATRTFLEQAGARTMSAELRINF